MPFFLDCDADIQSEVLAQLRTPPPVAVAQLPLRESYLPEGLRFVLSQRSDKEPERADKKQELEEFDGFLLGDGELRDPERGLEELKPFTPKKGVDPDKPTTFYVNGITNTLERAQRCIKKYAEQSKAPTYGIYNATEGAGWDVWQAILDKADFCDNPAVETLREVLRNALSKGETIRLIGDSQGAIIVSRALQDIAEELEAQGLTQEQVEASLSTIQVETIGGAAWYFPDGPQYVHYVNESDPIPGYFGLSTYGLSEDAVDELLDKIEAPDWMRYSGEALLWADTPQRLGFHPGKDARIIRFDSDESDWIGNHIMETYMEKRLDFDEARKLPAVEPLTDPERPLPLALIYPAVVITRRDGW